MKKPFILILFLSLSINLFATSTKLTPEGFVNIGEFDSSIFFEYYLSNKPEVLKKLQESIDKDSQYNAELQKIVNIALQTEGKNISKDEILAISELDFYDWRKFLAYEYLIEKYSYEQLFYKRCYYIISFYDFYSASTGFIDLLLELGDLVGEDSMDPEVIESFEIIKSMISRKGITLEKLEKLLDEN